MEEEQEKLVSRHQDLVTKDETIVHLLTSICYSSLRRLGAILRDESDVLTVSCDCQ
jgi:hypothetical protein